MGDVVIGVDVGTGSARAGVFDLAGRLLGVARCAIATWREPGGVVEQSTSDIWAAVASAVRAAMAEAGAAAAAVRGIGFDATCSLVLVDAAGQALPVGSTDDPRRDVMAWMDHRAIAETRAINAGRHDVLAYVGGQLSPEMQTPKLVWLKTHMPKRYAGAAHFFDLSDWLTFRATGSTARSVCTVTCKWTYLAHEGRFDAGYFRAIGLGDLADEGFRRIGTEIVAPGRPLARGLLPAAAADLGLAAGTPVAASMIDAHAGALATIGGAGGDGRVALIMGTSACVMATTRDPVFVPGVWGPSYAALLPGLWLSEGGQSAAGAAIDHLVRQHPATPALEAGGAGTALARLEANILARAGSASAAARLAGDLHVLPDFLGNRSPHADPDARAVIAGLGLESDAASLERLYMAGLCGLGAATREVIETMRARGIACDLLVMSGGASRSALVRQIIADATGTPVGVPETAEPVLLGAALLGAVAGGAHPGPAAASAAMARLSATVAPDPDFAGFHDAKYRVFGLMRQLDKAARTVMGSASADDRPAP